MDRYDFSTISMDVLTQLDRYILPRTYHLGDPGLCCFLKPPGHPSYFLRVVYTQRGRVPRNSRASVVIKAPDGELYIIAPGGARDWESLERFLSRLWVPLPLEHPRTKAWIEAVYSYYRDSTYIEEPYNPNEHGAVKYIREFYPEYEPDIELARRPPLFLTWWETMAERPTPDTCPGESWAAHPVNGAWCQVCGWGTT